jgi:hypothetical protein
VVSCRGLVRSLLPASAQTGVSWPDQEPDARCQAGVSHHRLRQRAAGDAETAATAASLRALARRIQVLDAEIADHTRAITALVRAWRPELLTPCGVGPIVAAIVLCAWSHPGRCGSDAAFAMLGGARPDPGFQRPDGQGSPQPIWGSPAQPGPAPDRPDQAAL